MSKIKIDRKVAMSEANAMFANKKNGFNRSQALKQGYKVAKIRALFAAGLVATVTFVKADGTERVANALPAATGEYLLTGTGTHQTPKANLLFVDSDIGEFRSLVKSRIISVEDFCGKCCTRNISGENHLA